jgi:hypothetical protein
MMMKADKKRRNGVALGLGELEVLGSGLGEGVDEREEVVEGVGVVVGVDDDVDDCDLELFRVDDGDGGDLEEVADNACGDLVKVTVVAFVADGVLDKNVCDILVGDGVFEEENESDESDGNP